MDGMSGKELVDVTVPISSSARAGVQKGHGISLTTGMFVEEPRYAIDQPSALLASAP